MTRAAEAVECGPVLGTAGTASPDLDRSRSSGPGAAAKNQHRFAPDDTLGFGSDGIRRVLARGPLPHIADHSVTAHRREVAQESTHRRRPEGELIEVGHVLTRPHVAPGI